MCDKVLHGLDSLKISRVGLMDGANPLRRALPQNHRERVERRTDHIDYGNAARIKEAFDLPTKRNVYDGMEDHNGSARRLVQNNTEQLHVIDLCKSSNLTRTMLELSKSRAQNGKSRVSKGIGNDEDERTSLFMQHSPALST